MDFLLFFISIGLYKNSHKISCFYLAWKYLKSFRWWAGIIQDNITHRVTDMKKVVNLPTTPGGTTIFKETEITSISDMILKWEEQEKSDGKGEGKKLSRGRRVSELSMRFEEGDPSLGGGNN